MPEEPDFFHILASSPHLVCWKDDYDRLRAHASQLAARLEFLERSLFDAEKMCEAEWVEKGIAALQDRLGAERERVDAAEAALALMTTDFRTTQGALADAQDALARLTAERAKVLEEAAQECERIETARWTAYKTGHGPERASEHVQGESNGAARCAAAIRALASKDGAG